MRLRKIKNAYEQLLENKKYFVASAELNKGKWNSCFMNSSALHIEIGCGKGQFIIALAKKNPDINYIAIEKYDSVLLRVSEKLMEEELPNIRIALMDATHIENYFSEGEVDRIYLNFSDPWPKTPHAKRRLTSKGFLEQYAILLKSDGEIHQKTDNRKLFEFSLEQFNQNGWLMKNISLDLHQDTEKYPDNITTEFEDKWSKLGPIYRVEAYKRNS